MSDSTTIHKMYKYRLYRCHKQDRKLRHKLFVASTVWNHFIAFQRRYYRLTQKYISLHAMNKHVLKLRKTQRFVLWRDLHSQVCQNVCRRVDDAYQRFFKKLAQGRQKFKKARRYSSFTFPQSGYQLVSFNQNEVKDNGKYARARASLKIEGETYQFVQHRPMMGEIKTLTVKRDPVGRLWLIFSVVEEQTVFVSSTGKSGGFDFGLKTFLTDDEGRGYTSAQYFAHGIETARKLNRRLAGKVEGSHRYKRARRALAKHSADVANKRRDHHFKLAHRLGDDYDTLYFEDLNIAGMKRLWGRKVSDLSFSSFLTILKWVASKRGKTIVQIGRFERTTGKCSHCGQLQKLELRERTFHCDSCHITLDRDHNAAINILRAGASAPYLSDAKTKVRLRSRVDGSSPRL